MSTKTNKHGVKAPVQPKGKVLCASHARKRVLSATVAKKAAKHRTAFAKLART